MRTTVEIPDDLRAELASLAAKRGLRGFSALVTEAIECYLQQLKERERNKQRALALEGIWADEDPEKIEKAIESAWEGWDVDESGRR